MSTVTFPNWPNDLVQGIRVQQSSLEFWDVPVVTLDPSNSYMSSWDVCYLAGLPLPGICHVSSKKHHRLDVKASKGRDSTITFVGNDPCQIVITCKIWTPSHLDMLQGMVPILKPQPTTQSPGSKVGLLPVDIAHPSLALFGTNSVIIEALDYLEPAQPFGCWAFKIHCVEWHQPSKTDQTATPNGSQSYGNHKTAINPSNQNPLASYSPPSATNAGPN